MPQCTLKGMYVPIRNHYHRYSCSPTHVRNIATAFFSYVLTIAENQSLGFIVESSLLGVKSLALTTVVCDLHPCVTSNTTAL